MKIEKIQNKASTNYIRKMVSSQTPQHLITHVMCMCLYIILVCVKFQNHLLSLEMTTTSLINSVILFSESTCHHMLLRIKYYSNSLSSTNQVLYSICVLMDNMFRYMERRCKFLDNFPGYCYNTGNI